MRFGEEDKAQHAQGRCRGVGRDMGQVGFKFGARWQPVTKRRRRKVVVVKREKSKTDKNKKNGQKKQKIRRTKKRAKKINLVVAGLDLTAFLQDPEGCPFGPQVRPDSGFTYQL